ncbi:MAG: VPLPA-CTERM sorting domain-containing protein [Burkholderiaceae bacterium]|nr:VPLPA-CTERM sorting domain-containing protein [Burkholderiaceae bacterium]
MNAHTPSLAGLARTALLAIGLTATATAGAQTIHAARADFNAAVPNRYDYNFNTDGMVNILSSAVGHLADVSTAGQDPHGQAYGGALWGSIADAHNAFTTLRFDFMQPVMGFAFDDLDLNGSEWAIIDVSYVGGGTTRYALTTLTPFTPVFFGVTSMTGLASVSVFSDDTAAGLAPGSRANLIDDVSISTLPVPEPASVALLLAGLAVVGGVASRRRHQT